MNVITVGEIWNPESLSAYEESPDVIYVVDSVLNILYCNAQWDRFALSNGGRHLLRRNRIGSSIVEVTPAALRPFYGSLYARVLLEGEEAGCVYECSSPDTFRRYHMHMTRKDLLSGGSCLVIVNSLILEEPRPRPDTDVDFKTLREETGLITMCSHCRRTRIPGSGTWVWVPDLVRKMPLEVSHGLCPVCLEIHYGC